MTGMNSLAVAESYVFFNMRSEWGSSNYHVVAEMEGRFSEMHDSLASRARSNSSVRMTEGALIFVMTEVTGRTPVGRILAPRSALMKELLPRFICPRTAR